MKLINRLNQLITADAHAVLDSIEDPYVLLKQAIRDMAMIIEQQQQSLHQTKTHFEQLEQQAVILNKQLTQLDKDLDLCFESDNERLARSIVKKKLILNQRIELNQKNIQATKLAESNLISQIQSNQEEFQLINQQAEVLLANYQSSNKVNDIYARQQLDNVISEDDIEMALLNEKRKRVNS